EPRPNLAGIERSRAASSRLLGMEVGCEASDAWAGYVDLTPDGRPVIGPAGSLEGLYVLTGLSGHGFGLGPGAGLLAAQLVLGNEPVVDPAPFSFSRLSRPPEPGALRESLV
ncbi:MAG TPA: FAD-binding oxidoreductase, partial [Acidimicrobiales bacterium]|nr:FAD-binding oxidoreductase [Acidimicrobiales bacterium]